MTTSYAEWVEQKSCASKQVWTTERLAGIAAELLASYGRNGQKPVQPYECRYCGLWHLTSKEDRQ